MKKSGLKVFDIVQVVTSKYQEEVDFATVLGFTELYGEECAVIQYHYNSCPPQIVSTQYMKKHEVADELPS